MPLQWSGQFAEGGGNSGILSDKVRTIDARYSNVALAIKGNSFDNIILDDKGNDSLTGDAGKDIFIYSAGEDTVLDYTASDKVSLDTRNLIGADSITAENDNLVLNFDAKNKLMFKGFASLTPENTQPISGVTVESDKKLYVYTAYSVADMTKDKSRSVTLNSAAGSDFRAMNSFVTIDGKGGDNTLVGDAGTDIFFYAKGDAGTSTIANFGFGTDKLKIANGTISEIKQDGDSIQFAMTSGKKGDKSAIGWFNVDTSKKTAKDIAIKANYTYYWFADGTEGDKISRGDLITADKKVTRAQIVEAGYDVIDLGYATSLTKTGVAIHAGEYIFDGGGIRKK